MKTLLISTLILILFNVSLAEEAKDIYSVTMPSLGGKPVSFSQYKGKTLLIVNTASKCGYTPQYEGLQKLYNKYKEKGLVVLGFPSNDFKQEDLEGKKLAKFCKLNYGVEFPIFKKSHVNGAERNPLYKYLISTSTPANEDVSWNFEKFLVNKEGKVVGRYKSKVKPEDAELTKAIEAVL